MGYINPVMQYGIENFCLKAKEVGVDGLIIPDLPLEEYNEQYRELFESCNLSNIFLVTPNTSDARMKLLDESSDGFIYVVSSDSTTGNDKGIDGAEAYFKRIQAKKLNNPTLIGFNIKDNQTYSFASKYANGAIIGSAFIKAIKETQDLTKCIENFVVSVKKG